ncbi:MAG TPA: TIR domain-containing protein [Longimicrobium sp.]
MPKKKVFVSYDHSEDARYKRLLQAWDANPEFAFEFDSRGPDVPIDSVRAATVKQVLTRMMKDATHLLVLVGEKTACSKWVTWEIERAKQPDVKLKLAAVKLAKANATPPGLLGTGTAWATSFERDRLVDALRIASNNY